MKQKKNKNLFIYTHFWVLIVKGRGKKKIFLFSC